MSAHIEATIAEFQKKLQEQELEVTKTKDMINQLCVFAGKPIMYHDTQTQTAKHHGPMRSDEFYGQPLATAVRKVLEMRKAVGPATVKEIYETLLQGGYSFETKNDANAMRNLRISLSKNVALFHRLPNGRFGLVVWYPNIKKKTKTDTSQQNGEDEYAETNEGEETQE